MDARQHYTAGERWLRRAEQEYDGAESPESVAFAESAASIAAAHFAAAQVPAAPADAWEPL